MRPLMLIVPDEFGDEEVQVLLAQHDEVIEALDLNRLNPTFDVRLQIGRLECDPVPFRTVPGQFGVERFAKLRVRIVDYKLWGKPLGLGMSAEGNRLDAAPLLGRIGRSRADDHSSRSDVNERQQEELPHPSQRNDLLRQEVALPQGLGMHGDELMPGRFATFGSRLEAVFAHDPGDEFSGTFAPCQLAEFAEHAGGTPTGFASDFDNEIAEFHELGPAAFAGPVFAVGIQEPTGEGPWRDNGDQFPDR